MSPIASGIQPARKRNPVAPINSSLGVFRARRYIATGGDQIELSPPKTPENNPTPTCHPSASEMGRGIRNNKLTEKATIAQPMATVSIAVGNEVMNNEVIKILNIMATANHLYFIAICSLFSDRVNWTKLVKTIGKIISDIADVGSMIRVRNAMAAAGRPIPKNPLMTPAMKKTPATRTISAGSIPTGRKVS